MTQPDPASTPCTSDTASTTVGPTVVRTVRRRALRRTVRLAALDAASWLLAATVVGAVSVAGLGLGPSVSCAVAAALVHVVLGSTLGLYRPRRHPATLDEARVLALTTLGTGAAVTLGALAAPSRLSDAVAWPAPLPLVAGAVALVLTAALRVARRWRAERGLRPGLGAERALVFGAGHVGTHLVRQLLTDPTADLRPVGFLDDDASLRGGVVGGLRVLGGRSGIEAAVARTGAEVLVLAVARADAELVRDLTQKAEARGLRVVSVPTLGELLRAPEAPTRLRDVTLEDLVGRRPVDTDVTAIAEYIRGRRVLVTGAGGSIGSELARQLAGFAPAELVLLDRDETALQAVQVSLHGHGLLDTREVVLADIRDPHALGEVFHSRRPEVVFHAAALKHLPMLEQYPGEAWQTNVMGTLNVLEAATEVGVETFVNVSTDKAANPSSVLGRSKRLSERLTAGAAERTGRRYLSVRFGNVFGSRGSLVPLFHDLLERGRPLTVTHRDATRFFMSIPEACQLVVQAGAIGSPGEVLLLDMGEPVKILDIAERMIAMSGSEADIVFTGLRPGEKLHEELTGAGERDHRPVHPLISHTSVPPIDPCALDVDSITGTDVAEAFATDAPGEAAGAGPGTSGRAFTAHPGTPSLQ